MWHGRGGILVTLSLMYPASKRTKRGHTQLTLDDDYARQQNRNEIFNQMHDSQNWFIIDHDGWHLPATKDAHEWCGSWAYLGCLNVQGHANTECEGKGFVRTFQRSCYRADCEICWKKWLARESNKATRRIETYEKKSKHKVKHIIISAPKWDYSLNKKELSKKARSILKEIGCIGGSMIFHPFRYNRDYKEWYYSPHFHVLGFGWIDAVTKAYQKHGWIIKNKGTRDSTFATFYYQLSHAGIKKHNHALVWFGDLSYSKLKVEEDHIGKPKCPYCEIEMREVFFLGDYCRKPPDVEMEIFVDCKDWANQKPSIVNEKALSVNKKADESLRQIIV